MNFSPSLEAIPRRTILVSCRYQLLNTGTLSYLYPNYLPTYLYLSRFVCRDISEETLLARRETTRFLDSRRSASGQQPQRKAHIGFTTGKRERSEPRAECKKHQKDTAGRRRVCYFKCSRVSPRKKEHPGHIARTITGSSLLGCSPTSESNY